MATLTVRIDDEMERRLNQVASLRGVSRSDLVRDLLRRHLLVEMIDEIRKELIPYAEAAGWFTDEDVFRDIS
ncbi:MAG TPA: CopG family transcriptional regulator [Thermoanaerobaculia bacterium]|nr:CopG family transcriptional regulator [Thermoanaerobaculia bacterium]